MVEMDGRGFGLGVRLSAVSIASARHVFVQRVTCLSSFLHLSSVSGTFIVMLFLNKRADLIASQNVFFLQHFRCGPGRRDRSCRRCAPFQNSETCRLFFMPSNRHASKEGEAHGSFSSCTRSCAFKPREEEVLSWLAAAVSCVIGVD